MTEPGGDRDGRGTPSRERVPDAARSLLRGGIVGMALVALATAGLTLAALLISVVVSALG